MIPEWGDGRNYMTTDRILARIKVRVERAGDGPWRRCITTKGKAMTATCHACNWESLTYANKGWAERAADKHQGLYHDGRPNIISIKEARA